MIYCLFIKALKHNLNYFFFNISGDRGSIFTGVLYDHYSAPPGFCFDVLCRDTPIIVIIPFRHIYL